MGISIIDSNEVICFNDRPRPSVTVPSVVSVVGRESGYRAYQRAKVDRVAPSGNNGSAIYNVMESSTLVVWEVETHNVQDVKRNLCAVLLVTKKLREETPNEEVCDSDRCHSEEDEMELTQHSPFQP
ncbi:hypothetical protein J6590_026260 [Homalodisca vitripennis]|nr:hypothetical protein J6590_026260 [Homalodisca vitripennis]